MWEEAFGMNKSFHCSPARHLTDDNVVYLLFGSNKTSRIEKSSRGKRVLFHRCGTSIYMYIYDAVRMRFAFSFYLSFSECFILSAGMELCQKVIVILVVEIAKFSDRICNVHRFWFI